MSRPPVHKIRIIGGTHRGRRIDIPDRDGLRPSPSRVRETLFNWLQREIGGAHVLDAFAGSGALGLEALSRGAASVLFCEQDAAGVAALRKRLADWKISHARVQQGDAFHLTPSPSRYDLIFLDPPFATGSHTRALAHFSQDKWLKPNGKIYLEIALTHRDIALPNGWQWSKQSKAGHVYFGLIQRQENP